MLFLRAFYQISTSPKRRPRTTGPETRATSRARKRRREKRPRTSRARRNQENPTRYTRGLHKPYANKKRKHSPSHSLQTTNDCRQKTNTSRINGRNTANRTRNKLERQGKSKENGTNANQALVLRVVLLDRSFPASDYDGKRRTRKYMGEGKELPQKP